MRADKASERAWLDILTDEDLAFLKRFLLNSGSLKDLAGTYGISYPTVRLRLDRLIAKVTVVEEQRARDAFERMARGLCADGRFDTGTLKILLETHRDAKEKPSHEDA